VRTIKRTVAVGSVRSFCSNDGSIWFIAPSFRAAS
jgi:hypothetical protein